MIRVAMIGCGAFARLYHLPAILHNPAVDLIGIFDPQPAQETRDLAKKQTVPLAADLPDLFGNGKPDAVIVTTPHALHASHVEAALHAGCAVLCDKPFVLASSDAEKLAQLAQSRNLTNAVAYNRRFDPGHIRAQAIVAEGMIGDIAYVETVQLGYPTGGWYVDPKLAGGGAFQGRASHMADIVPWVLNVDPKQVRARVVESDDPRRADFGGRIELGFDGFDAHVTCLERGLGLWDELRIFGTTGALELRRPLTQPLGWKLKHTNETGDTVEELEGDQAIGRATEDFIAAVLSGSNPKCSFADAAQAVRIVELAYQSARQGEPWLML